MDSDIAREHHLRLDRKVERCETTTPAEYGKACAVALPPMEELRVNYRSMTRKQLAEHYRVSTWLIDKWLAITGIGPKAGRKEDKDGVRDGFPGDRGYGASRDGVALKG